MSHLQNLQLLKHSSQAQVIAKYVSINCISSTCILRLTPWCCSICLVYIIVHRLARETRSWPFTVYQKWSSGKQLLLIITHGRWSITKVWEQAPQRKPKSISVTWFDIEFHSNILDQKTTEQLSWLAWFITFSFCLCCEHRHNVINFFYSLYRHSVRSLFKRGKIGWLSGCSNVKRKDYRDWMRSV